MTIKELRIKHRQLLDKKRAVQQLLASGEGNPMELALIQEELIDVKAQIRAVSPEYRRVGKRSIGNNVQRSQDRYQYFKWKEENWAQTDDQDDVHKLMLQGMAEGLSLLSSKQRKIIELYQSELNITEIARRLNLNSSTVSRTLTLAKKRLQEEIQRFLQQKRLSSRLDLSDPILAKLVLSVLTPTQIAYMYLYYSEYLSLREISYLTGVSHSSILRTIYRALRNIGGLLGYQETELVNIDALDDLAYYTYCEIQYQDIIVPEDLRPQKVNVKKYHYSKRNDIINNRFELPHITIRSSTGHSHDAWDCNVPHNSDGKHGRLLAALLERVKSRNENPTMIFKWIIAIFSKLTSDNRAGFRWWKKNIRGKDPRYKNQT